MPSRTFSYLSFRGPVPESRSVMSHLVRTYCHSCAGRNRGHTVRANASHTRIIIFFYYCGLKSADYEILKLPAQGGRHWHTGTFFILRHNLDFRIRTQKLRSKFRTGQGVACSAGTFSICWRDSRRRLSVTLTSLVYCPMLRCYFRRN